MIGAATLLPTIIGGIVLSAAAAFTITTGDSYLLSAAANFCIDLYSKVIFQIKDTGRTLFVKRMGIRMKSALPFEGRIEALPDGK